MSVKTVSRHTIYACRCRQSACPVPLATTTMGIGIVASKVGSTYPASVALP
jgi:hypothetical protein